MKYAPKAAENQNTATTGLSVHRHAATLRSPIVSSVSNTPSNPLRVSACALLSSGSR